MSGSLSCFQASCFFVLDCFSRFGLAASRRKAAGWLPFRVAGCPSTAAGLLLPILVCLFPVAVCLLPCVGLLFFLAGSFFFVLFFFSRFGRAASRRKPAGWLPFRVAGFPFTAAGLLLPILVCLFPVAVCLFPCVGLPRLLAGSLFFWSVLFFSFRACRVSAQARWMAPVSRCRVPAYGRRAPASNASVPVSCCSVLVALCRASFLACRLLVFLSWIVFLVSGVPRLGAGPLDGFRFALLGARLRPQGSCFQS